MFWFDLPLAVIVAFIFHNVVRDPLISNLPPFLENKCRQFMGFRWNAYFRQHFVKIIISMLIGIALHLVWDAFTHLNLAYPDAEDSTILIGPFRLFKVLQNCDSILGMIIMAVYIFILPGEEAKALEPAAKMMFRIDVVPVKYSKLKYWSIFGAAAITTVVIATGIIMRNINFVLFIDICIAGILLGFVMAGLLTRAARDHNL